MIIVAGVMILIAVLIVVHYWWFNKTHPYVGTDIERRGLLRGDDDGGAGAGGFH